MHAAGHSFMAAAAGVLTGALARGSAPMDALPIASFLATAAARIGLPRGSDGAAPVFLAIAIAAVFAAIAKLVGGALASWSEARIAGDVAARMRLTLLDDVLQLHALRGPRHDDHGSAERHIERVERAEHGEHLAALTTHVQDVERGVAQGALAEVRAFIQLVPLTLLLVVLAPRLASSALVTLASFGVFAFALRRAFKRAHERASASAGALVTAADEAVRHAELWATYGAKSRIRAHVERIGQSIAREAARIRVRAAVISSTSEVLGAIALVLVLMLAASGALGVDHGTVVPFAIAFFMAYKPLRDLVDARIARARGEEALRVAFGDRGRAAHAPLASGGPAHAALRRATWPLERLVIDLVTTRHGAHEPLSVVIPPGKIAAIVGETGVGKTSLMRALLGLDRLAGGAIHYGSTLRIDQAGVGPSERPFAWVPQDAPVVLDTLAVNVGLGHADGARDAQDGRDDFVGAHEEAVRILRELGADKLASSLGAGDVLGEGRALSGGERQWINVARAFATGLPVLLLDEPTASLDAEAQARVLDAITRLRGKRTVLLVTHRPEPIAIADVVVRLTRLAPSSSEDSGIKTA